MYPDNDTQFEDHVIESVQSGHGTYVITCDGWSLSCGDNCPIDPQPGMTARQYGRGIGSPVRGLFIDGNKFWYRSEKDDEEHREIELYGADAADWLARWDAGKGVWSIEMGGLGPGYEQCIQIVTAEVLRHLITAKVDSAKQYDGDAWRTLSDQIDTALFSDQRIKDLGLSGSQVGAAKSLATKLYRDGPRGVMTVPEIKDRHIQVSKNFPRLAA